MHGQHGTIATSSPVTSALMSLVFSQELLANAICKLNDERARGRIGKWTAAGLVDKIPASCRGAFERLGTDAAQMAVTAGSVVEHLNVIEDVGSGQISGFVDAFADTFLF